MIIRNIDLKKFIEGVKVVKSTKTKSVFLVIENNELYIEGNFKTVKVKTIINCETEKNGVYHLNLENLKPIMALKNGTLEINTDKKIFSIGNINFTIQSLNEEDYKPMQIINDNIQKIEQKELKYLLSCNYAVSDTDWKVMLQNINVDQGKFCAIDGYRMSIKSTDKIFNDVKFNICSQDVNVINKLLKKNSSDIVNITRNNEYVQFKINNTIVQCDFIQSKFVKYKSLIPDKKSFNTSITVNTKEFLEIIKTVYKMDKKAIFKMNITGEKINIGCLLDKGMNAYKDTINCKKTGKDLLIAFNPKYLLDIFKLQTADKTTINFINEVSPAVVYGKNKDLDLVLPIRIMK